MTHMDAINLKEKFELFGEYWSPKIIAELNGQHIKLAKVKGEFIWHHHEREDELFLVVKGMLTIKFKDREVQLREGEMIVVPAGVEHKPIAAEETHLLLFEPASTLNTGNQTTDRTVKILKRI